MIEKYTKQIEEKKIQAERLMNKSQFTKCNIVIHSASVAAAAAGAMPIPMADTIPITSAQISMVIALGKIFDTQITESTAKGLIKSTMSAYVGRNIIKAVPVIGWGVAATVAATFTEIIGWSTAIDFSKGAKLKWEEEHKTTEDVYKENKTSQSETENFSSENDSKIKKENYYKTLALQAEEFISGKKKRFEYESEYGKLLSEFEEILDEVSTKHWLRQLYDKLTLVID